jgi:integrase/recombinase XerC
VPHPISEAQLAQAMAGSNHRWRIILALAAYAGLRCCEITVLEREHITPAALRVAGKGGREATVPTHPALWMLVAGEPAGLLARTPAGGRFRDLSAAARAHFRRLELFGVGLHQLRHRFGTLVYRANHDLLAAQRALRHASPVTTTRYTLLDDEDLRGTIGGLPWLA